MHNSFHQYKTKWIFFKKKQQLFVWQTDIDKTSKLLYKYKATNEGLFLFQWINLVK